MQKMKGKFVTIFEGEKKSTIKIVIKGGTI